ncbi:MAG: hypothetical protein IPK71_05280 [Myxococcales bacterium]|nr:hypothetical protein [Myxococcales bacterium]
MRISSIAALSLEVSLLACGGETTVVDGGAPATTCGEPGVSFSCGGVICNDARPVCCQYANLPARCVERGGTCAVDGGAPAMQTTQCDDANDCGDGGACYRSFNKGTSKTDYLCGSTRPGILSQVCRLSCECLDGKTCNAGECK